MRIINASHGGHSGHIVYAMAFAKRIAMNQSARVNLYVPRDRPAQLAPGMEHPSGRQYMMSEAAFDFIRPLLAAQPYINDVFFVREAEIPADAVRLDPYRFVSGINLAAGNIVDFPGKIYGIPVDASQAWLDTRPVQPPSWLITVGFSKRYRNTAIDYSFLARVEGVRFVGLPAEYDDFRSRHGLESLQYHECASALELAEAIRSSRVFIGNQSMAFAIAEGLKVNRALEAFEPVPNVIPSGPGGGSFIFQSALFSLLKAWDIRIPEVASRSAPARYALCLLAPPSMPSRTPRLPSAGDVLPEARSHRSGREAAASPQPSSAPTPPQPSSAPTPPELSSAPTLPQLSCAQAPAHSSSADAAPVRIRVVCATRAGREEFFSETALGKSLTLYRPMSVDVRLFPRNTVGLPSVYNTAISESSGDDVILLFVHDDVHLCDFHWADRLREAVKTFDVVGLAGNRRRVPRQPTWMFVDERLEPDRRDNLSGLVAHGRGIPSDSVDFFGPCKQEVKLLDGVFLAARTEVLAGKCVRFDERFDFHFYDLDFCRQAELAGLRMGTWPISIVHESTGGFGTDGWRRGYDTYLGKWKD